MIKRAIKEYLIITVAAIVAAAAIYFFMLPSKTAVGSGTALAMVIAEFLPLPVSAISLSLNIILLTLGFLLVGREFGAKTVYVAILLPISLGVFEIFFPNFQSLTNDPLLDMLCHILIIGMASAVLFSCNASSGGLDIVAKIMNKYLKMDIGKALTVAGFAVSLSTILCGYDRNIVVLSVLGTYVNGLVVDRFIFGLNIKRRVCIISKELDTIVDFVLHDLHSGATLYDSIGAFDNTPRREMVAIVDKHEYSRLMDFVKKADPSAFVTVYSVNEVRYRPKVY